MSNIVVRSKSKSELVVCKMNKKILFLALSLALIIWLFMENFQDNTADTASNAVQEQRIATKIIDGDTLVVSGGDTIRLLGIDTDERGYPCYSVAKKRLENLTLGKQVILESGKENKDQYDRYLRYILVDSENINIQMVKEGLAVARILEEDKYSQEIRQAETLAIQNKIGCKWNSTA
jgi:micrococcal nuclease